MTGMPEEVYHSFVVDDQPIHNSAEAYDTMASVRPCRLKPSLREAIEKLSRKTLTQFDPLVVKAFVGVSRAAGKSVWGKRTKEAE